MISWLDAAFTEVGLFAVFAFLWFIGRFVLLGKKRILNFPTLSFFIAAISMCLVWGITGLVTDKARSEVSAYLDGLHGAEVIVDGRSLARPEAFLADLQKSWHIMSHHSHPTINLKVEVKSHRGSLRLILGRDSGNAEEYWVFYPGYSVTTKNEISRIRTIELEQTSTSPR